MDKGFKIVYDGKALLTRFWALERLLSTLTKPQITIFKYFFNFLKGSPGELVEALRQSD
jgi:hypothetical protein